LKNQKRAGFLDEVRGFAILCMVVYHAAVTLREFHDITVPILFEDWFSIVQQIFAGAFILISGIVCRYSRNNIKRGVQCFFLGMVVTYVTAIVVPQVTILFGILHFLGISMMIYGLGERLWDIVPSLVGIVASVFMFILTINLPHGSIGIGGFSAELPRSLYNARLLFPLGFKNAAMSSADYFPLMPWLFLFFAGAYFGIYVRDGRCPEFFYKVRVPFLAAAGRHTIWIYMLHQPIIYFILQLIYG
jgi:uncharacterized membrane protein